MMRLLFFMMLLTMADVGAASEVARASERAFELRPAQLSSDRYTEVARDFSQDDPLVTLAGRLNSALTLPVTIGLRYAECERANAYYDKEAREILLCFELIEQLAEDFGERIVNDEELAKAVAGAYLFITLHEVGHALVDVLELPITGREEDAVDQLSAWLLIGEDEGNAAVLDAAASFSLASEKYDLAEGDFAGLHSLDQQRYYNMICWVYGSNPQAYAELVESANLPAARAEHCKEEYVRLDRSWSKLLGRHMRD